MLKYFNNVMISAEDEEGYYGVNKFDKFLMEDYRDDLESKDIQSYLDVKKQSSNMINSVKQRVLRDVIQGQMPV